MAVQRTHGLKRHAPYTGWDYKSTPERVVIGTHRDGCPATMDSLEISIAPGKCSEAEGERVRREINDLTTKGLARVGYFDRLQAAAKEAQGE